MDIDFCSSLDVGNQLASISIVHIQSLLSSKSSLLIWINFFLWVWLYIMCSFIHRVRHPRCCCPKAQQCMSTMERIPMLTRIRRYVLAICRFRWTSLSKRMRLLPLQFFIFRSYNRLWSRLLPHRLFLKPWPRASRCRRRRHPSLPIRKMGFIMHTRTLKSWRLT